MMLRMCFPSPTYGYTVVHVAQDCGRYAVRVAGKARLGMTARLDERILR